MAFERLKRMLKSANVYGETARRMEKPEAAQSPEKAKSQAYTSAQEQDRMKADLEKAREAESQRINLSTYAPPRTAKVQEEDNEGQKVRRRALYGVGLQGRAKELK